MARPAKWLLKVALFALFGAALAVGCGGPKYPSCDSDEDCNAEGHHGVCVNHTCVECRSSDACKKGQECSKNGQCTDIADYCDDSHACEGGGTCGKDHRCQPKVASLAPTECDDDHPCKAPGSRCQNGHCVMPPPGGPGCTDFPAPKFDFESPTLRSEAKDVLQRLAKCLMTGTLKGRRILLTGHCDARGEYEFNMGLGAERAEGVKTFLTGLGVDTAIVTTSSRGKLDANGTDELGWANDRRVDIEVR
jgi:hypothetical protein